MKNGRRHTSKGDARARRRPERRSRNAVLQPRRRALLLPPLPGGAGKRRAISTADFVVRPERTLMNFLLPVTINEEVQALHIIY